MAIGTTMGVSLIGTTAADRARCTCTHELKGDLDPYKNEARKDLRLVRDVLIGNALPPSRSAIWGCALCVGFAAGLHVCVVYESVYMPIFV